MLAKLTPEAAGIVAIFTLAIFLGCLVMAYMLRDSPSIQMLVGASIGMAGTAVNFYLGSSKGSQNKDATIAALSSTPPVVPPVAVEPVQQPQVITPVVAAPAVVAPAAPVAPVPVTVVGAPT